MSCPKFTVWHPADLKREESGDKQSIIKRHIYSGARLGQIWALVSWTKREPQIKPVENRRRWVRKGWVRIAHVDFRLSVHLFLHWVHENYLTRTQFLMEYRLCFSRCSCSRYVLLYLETSQTDGKWAETVVFNYHTFSLDFMDHSSRHLQPLKPIV